MNSGNGVDGMMFTELCVLALLYAVGYDTKEKYEKLLDDMLLRDELTDVVLELESMSVKNATLHTLSLMNVNAIDTELFGKMLMNACQEMYLKEPIHEFGKRMYQLWNLIPSEIGENEPFYILAYADDFLPYDETSCRELYEKAFNYYIRHVPESDIQDMQQFENITLTGRLCYLFMCVERYLVTLYPQKDWKPIAKRMWQWTNQEYWETAWDVYSEIVPEFILEFDIYEETNTRAYDGNLKKEDYDEITVCFKGITNGNADDEICEVFMIPSDFGSLCEYSSFSYVDSGTLDFLKQMRIILEKHHIAFPDMSFMDNFRFDRNHSNEREKWGKRVNTEYLSIILNSDLSN